MTYPTISPKLTLDFANSRQLDPRITFSRSSSATYVHPDTGLITTVPDGVARFERQGFLIEEARTNLVRASTPTGSGLGNGWTQRANTTITTNADVAPDGTTTATSVVPNSGSTDYAYTDHTLLSATTANCVVSAFAKPLGNYTSCLIQAGHTSGGALIWKFDFTTGVPNLLFETGGFTGFGSTGFMEPLANGWWRVGFTGPSSLDGMSVNGREGWGGGQPAGDGVSGALFWGCQIEEGGFQTSFIPTTGSTITRAADVASITGTNFSSWYNQSEGTLLYEHRTPSSQDNALLWGLNGATDSDRIFYYLRAASGGDLRFDTRAGGTLTSVISITNPRPDVYKTAIGIAPQNIKAVLNGGALSEDTGRTGDLPTVTQFFIGSTTVAGTRRGVGHISRLSYYHVRVSDAALQALTA